MEAFLHRTRAIRKGTNTALDTPLGAVGAEAQARTSRSKGGDVYAAVSDELCAHLAGTTGAGVGGYPILDDADMLLHSENLQGPTGAVGVAAPASETRRRQATAARRRAQRA